MTAQRFNPFPPVSGKHGAPMGRLSRLLDVDPDETPISALCAAGPAGEYDSGGAYWGTCRREGPVYAVWVKGKGRDGVAYVRAFSRDAAKRKALEI